MWSMNMKTNIKSEINSGLQYFRGPMELLHDYTSFYLGCQNSNSPLGIDDFRCEQMKIKFVYCKIASLIYGQFLYN